MSLQRAVTVQPMSVRRNHSDMFTICNAALISSTERITCFFLSLVDCFFLSQVGCLSFVSMFLFLRHHASVNQKFSLLRECLSCQHNGCKPASIALGMLASCNQIPLIRWCDWDRKNSWNHLVFFNKIEDSKMLHWFIAVSSWWQSH